MYRSYCGLQCAFQFLKYGRIWCSPLYNVSKRAGERETCIQTIQHQCLQFKYKQNNGEHTSLKHPSFSPCTDPVHTVSLISQKTQATHLPCFSLNTCRTLQNQTPPSVNGHLYLNFLAVMNNAAITALKF